MQQEEPCAHELISISGVSRQCSRLSEAVGVHSKTTLRGIRKMQIWNIYAD